MATVAFALLDAGRSAQAEDAPAPPLLPVAVVGLALLALRRRA